MSISNLNPFRLTKLYSEAKVSANNVANTELQPVAAATTDSPEFKAVQRKFRIQKDRLVTWGLQWSDESKANPSIDESIARAGLTENVDGIMKNIAGILEDVERMNGNGPTSKLVSESPLKIGAFPMMPTDGPRALSAADIAKCEDLCKDLSSCIDVLYELSRSRRAFSEGTYPGASVATPITPSAPEKTTLPPPVTKMVFSNRSYSSSGETLVTPTRVSTEKTLTAHDLPPRLDRQDLVLPQEPPPAYGSQASHAIRMIGHLKRSTPTSTYFASGGLKQEVQPTMIEYAPFDPTYRETGVRLPPTERLEALLHYFAKCNALPDPSLSGLLYCAGWFEDLDFSRYGIVYEIPKSVSVGGNESRPRDLRPSSLLSILQMASKSNSSTSGSARNIMSSAPPLEERFRLAQNVVRSFHRFSEEGLMHRDVSSSNILCFTKGPKSASPAPEASVADLYELSSPHVCGFDLFSEYSISSDAPDKPLNIYQHPDAAANPQNYRAEFDAYSLGLVLLEIGMWIPLSDLHKPRYSLSDFKRRIDSIWCKKLAAKCGSLYMHVVQDLLGAASRRRSSPSSSPESTRHQLSKMYAKSVNRLRRMCLIDESEPLETSSPESMQNSALAAMVQQGLAMDQEQAINQWTEKTQMYAEPSTTVDPSLLQPAARDSAGLRLDGSSRTGSVSEHQQHTLPAAIEEGNEESLSRHGSTASNNKSRLAHRKPGLERTGSNVGAISTTHKTAAQTILRAWRSRRDTPSFKEYKRKVSLIQRYWRKRRDSRQNSVSTSNETETSSFDRSAEQLSSQRLEQQSISESATLRINPQAPVPRKKLRIQPVKLPASLLNEWHTDLLPRLERLLSRALRDSPETVSIDLLCVGETPAKARPTIFVTCSSTARVKAVLSRHFTYNRDAYDLKVRRGSIRRSKSHSASRRIRRAHRSMAVQDDSATDSCDDIVPLNPYHQKRPMCGASIGAYVDGKHLPPVSYGGVIAVDSGDGPELYGMTVHHLLDPPSDGEDGDESEDGESGYFDGEDEQAVSGATRSSAAGGNSWLASLGGAPGLALDGEDEHSPFLEISDDSSITSEADIPELDYSSDEEEAGLMYDSRASTEGDMNGVSPHSAIDEPTYVTQPAIDDVEAGFFPCESDKDEDHLSSHKLGQVYASSGIRRWRRHGTVHEIDWALLKLDDDRLQPINVVQGGRKYLRPARRASSLLDSRASHRPDDSGIDTGSPSPLLEAAAANRQTLRPKLLEPVDRSPSFSAADDEYPTSIVPADKLGSLRVHCVGRTSGLREGVIGDTMSSVRIYRRRSFSRSWHVLGGFGIGGDSGAWILDNDTGRVCGHVLAFAERNSLAYICPLEIMFEDILRVLGAKSISLPGGEEAVVRAQDLDRRSTFGTDASRGSAGKHIEDDEDDELHFRMNSLELDDGDVSAGPGAVLRSSPRVLRQGGGMLRSAESGRDRLMYARGGVLAPSGGETFRGAVVDREMQSLYA